MSLIGNTYIDNLNIPESTSYDGWFGLGGVIVGFGLTFFYDRYKGKKEINKVGKSFESILIDIKEKCKFQINHIDSYQNIIKENKSGILGIAFLFEQNPISFIDKLKLFDYYFNIRKSKSINHLFNTSVPITEEIIHKKINNSFNEIGVLYFNIKAMNDELTRISFNVTNLTNDYVSKFNTFASEVTHFKNVNDEEFNKNNFALHLETLINDHAEKGISSNDILLFKDSLHDKILDIPVNPNYHLYKVAFDFDTFGSQIINSIEAYNIHAIEYLDTVKTTIKETYKLLYKEDITTKAVN